MDILQEMEQRRLAGNLSRRRVSLDAGLDSTYFRKAILGDVNPTFAALQRLGRALREGGAPLSDESEQLLGIVPANSAA